MRGVSEDYGGKTAEFAFRDKKYVFRELTVEENDECIDASLNPDGNTINNRTMTRLMITKSVMEPTGFTLSDLLKLPFAAYQHMVELVNDLNDPDQYADPSPSTPDGSDAQK